MTTIKDVARRAGVSVATVSYVLNAKRSVRPETERRIRAAIRELGCAPNVSARQLASGRSSLLGAVVPDIRNRFFPDIAAAFAEAAALGAKYHHAALRPASGRCGVFHCPDFSGAAIRLGETRNLRGLHGSRPPPTLHQYDFN